MKIHTLLLTALSLGFAACDLDDDSTDTGYDTGGEAEPSVLRLLADRLVAVQNDDGSFDWQRAEDEALTPEETGYQNVTGVTAMGLFGALNHESDRTWEAAIQASADYFDARLDDLVADPTDPDAFISSANWTFLAWHLAYTPDRALNAEAIAGLDALLDALDAAYGDDPDARVDGLYNYTLYRRSSIPGIIPWDLALWVEGLDAMSGLDSRFSDDADGLATRLSTYLDDTFLPAWDADGSLAYGDLSLSMPLYVLVYRRGSDATQMRGLLRRLEALVDSDGMVSNGSDDDGPQQSTAYALLALKAVGSSSARLVNAWLTAEVDVNGVILDEETGLETYEIEGEALRALAE